MNVVLCLSADFCSVLICRFLGCFLSRNERLDAMGDRAKNFTNIFIKNFGNDIEEEKLLDQFASFGNIVSSKVSLFLK